MPAPTPPSTPPDPLPRSPAPPLPRIQSKGLRGWVPLLLLLTLSIAARIISAALQGDLVVELPGTADQVSYDALAQRVLAGHGFSFATNWWPATRGGEPTAHWSFAYTLFLTVVYAIFGPHPLAARLVQAVVVGLLQPLLAWRIGQRLFGRSVGILAAGLTAVYAYFAYYGGALMTEAFTMVSVLWLLDISTGLLWRTLSDEMPPLSSSRRRRATPWLLLGLALGLAALLRQVALIFAPFLFVWIIWCAIRRHGELAPGARQRILATVGGLCITLAVVVVLIAPWTVRNAIAFHRFVLLNTNAGYVLFWANHPIHGTNFQAILRNESYQALIPPELRGFDEAAIDTALFQRGIGFITADPIRFVILSMSRLKDYFLFWPLPDSGLTSNISRTFSFGLLLPFMLHGIWLAIRRSGPRVPDTGQPLALIGTFIASYTMVHLLSWSLVRYRLPIDAVLVIFAALSMVDLAARLSPCLRSLFRREPLDSPERSVV